MWLSMIQITEIIPCPSIFVHEHFCPGKQGLKLRKITSSMNKSRRGEKRKTSNKTTIRNFEKSVLDFWVSEILISLIISRSSSLTSPPTIHQGSSDESELSVPDTVWRAWSELSDWPVSFWPVPSLSENNHTRSIIGIMTKRSGGNNQVRNNIVQCHPDWGIDWLESFSRDVLTLKFLKSVIPPLWRRQ